MLVLFVMIFFDCDKIKKKYLKPKELSKISLDEVVEDKEVEEEDRLDKVEINGKQYYYKTILSGIYCEFLIIFVVTNL